MPKLPAAASTLAGASLIALAAAGAAHAAALEQTVPATIRLLYQEGRYIEFGVAYTDPDQSGEGATLPPNALRHPDRRSCSGQHRRRLRGPLELQRRLQGRPERPALLRADLRPAALGRHPLRRRRPSRRCRRPRHPALRRQHGRPEDLPDHRRARLRRHPERQGLRRAPRPAARRRGGGLLRLRLLGQGRRQVGLRLPARRRLRAPRHRAPGGAHLPLEDRLRPRHRREFTRSPTRRPATPRPTSTRRSRCSSTSRPASRRRRWSSATSAGSTGRSSRSARRSTSRPTAALLGEPRPLVDYADDWWTYNLGVGRQLTDALAGSLSITCEPDVGGEMTSLGPYDGRTTGTAALSYDYGQWNFTGGLTYGVLGDTENLLADRLQRRLGLGRRAPGRLHLLTACRQAPNASPG